jgi:hypothetical protein
MTVTLCCIFVSCKIKHCTDITIKCNSVSSVFSGNDFFQIKCTLKLRYLSKNELSYESMSCHQNNLHLRYYKGYMYGCTKFCKWNFSAPFRLTPTLLLVYHMIEARQPKNRIQMKNIKLKPYCTGKDNKLKRQNTSLRSDSVQFVSSYSTFSRKYSSTSRH